MRQIGFFVSVALVLLSAGLLPCQQTTLAAPTNKKHCHYVTKKVHGKKKRLKVCTQPKKPPAPKPSPTTTPVDYNALATRLAGNILSASSGDARYRALVAALDELHVPVVNGDSSVAGAISASGTFFLPAGEVHALARGYDSSSLVSLSVPAGILAAAHVETAGAAPTAASLHDALVASLGRATAAPGNSHSLAGSLLLQLGLQASPARDLRTTPADQPALDPLQLVIVLVEGLLPVTHHAAGSRTRRAMLQTGPEICTDPAQSISTRWWDQSVSTADLSGGSSITFVNLTTVVGTATVWQYQLQVDTSMPDGTETHYGPANHDPPLAGKDLVFSIHVNTQAVDTAPCPPPFAIPTNGAGVDVSWQDADLLPHGQVDLPVPITDNTGTNRLTFHPRDEAIPGMGSEVTRPVTVTAELSFQNTVPDPILRAELNTLFTASPITFHATISYHQPRGFKFSGLRVHYWIDLGGVHSDTFREYSGHMCGADPYASPWQLQAEQTVVSPTGTTTDSTDISWDFKADTVNPGLGDFFQILPGPPAQMQVTWGAQAPEQPARDSATVPIEEDTSCPQPST